MWTAVDAVSTMDTALLIAGVLTVRQCFTEPEIVDRATAIYQAADWDWFVNKDRLMRMCWSPDRQFICPRDQGSDEWVWAGYNEGFLLYILALSSPDHPIPSLSWDQWKSGYVWGTYDGYRILLHSTGALFAHQYPQAWLDLRSKTDGIVDYFLNARYATLANRAYSQTIYANPPFDLWGFTSSDGPVGNTCQGIQYADFGYPPASVSNNGTVAPSAAGGSIVFTPEESISTLRFMYETYHDRLWGLFGLKDSLNPLCHPGWFDNDYLGNDTGITLVMIENYRSGLIWKMFMNNQEILNGMQKANFVSDSETG
jgi:hypothetical protein